MYKIPKKKARLRGTDGKAVRFNKSEYSAYQDWLIDKGICQVCDISCDLDAPHHTKQGLGVKDDRSLICICVDCHREIHTIGFSNLNKTRTELEEIGKSNWVEYSELM